MTRIIAAQAERINELERHNDYLTTLMGISLDDKNCDKVEARNIGATESYCREFAELVKAHGELEDKYKGLESQLAEATKPLAWREGLQMAPADATLLLIDSNGEYSICKTGKKGAMLGLVRWLPLSELTGHHEVNDAPR
jgi:hypothetical protein